MPRLRNRMILLLIASMLVAGCGDSNRESGAESTAALNSGKSRESMTFTPAPGKEAIIEKLHAIRLPVVDFDSISLAEAVEWLEEQSRLHDTEDRTGVNISLTSEVRRSITLQLTDVTLYHALERSTTEVKCSFHVDQEAVIVLRNDLVDDATLYTRVFDVPEELESTTTADAQSLLEAYGVEFPEGASARFQEDGKELFVRNVRKQMLLIDMILENASSLTADEQKEWNEGVAAIEAKLKSIVLPSVDFDEITLYEALTKIEAMSVEHDSIRFDSYNRGLNVDWEWLTDRLDAPVSLKLTNVRLGEALRYTTSLVQAKYRIEPAGVRVLPISSGGHGWVVTRSFSIRPDFLDVTAADSGIGAISQSPFQEEAGSGESHWNPTKERLIQAGISFQAGDTAFFDKEDSLLIVRADYWQMDLVESYVDSLNSSAPKEWVDSEASRIQAKLTDLRLSPVEFNATPLKRVIDYIHQRSLELDTSSRPWERGIKVKFQPARKEPDPMDYPTDDPFESPTEFLEESLRYQDYVNEVMVRPVTAQFSDTSFSETIETIAESVGLTAYIEGATVVLTDESAASHGKIER